MSDRKVRKILGLGGVGLTSAFVNITPSMAQQLLEMNVMNRSVVNSTTEFYTRQMKNGEWMETNQGVGFTRTGNCCDGQHRLISIINSGKTVRMLVVLGLPDKAQAVTDIGMKRSAGDSLMRFAGCKAKFEGTVICAIISYLHGRGQGQDGRIKKIAPGEYTKFYHSHKDLYDKLAAYYRLRECADVPGFRNAPVFSGLFVSYRTYGNDVDDFVEKMISGAGLEPGSPILVLRKALYRISRSEERGNPSSKRESYGKTILAVDRWVNGGEFNNVGALSRAYSTSMYALEKAI